MNRTRLNNMILPIVALSLAVLFIPVKPLAQTNADAITKNGLLKALKARALSSRKLIQQVEEYGVSFPLTSTDEQEIRLAGKYLGKKGLNGLVASLQRNYRAAVTSSPSPPPRPTPTPDWKESDEAKKLASEILTEIQNLIDEGNLIDLTDYQAAAKAYLVWVEKSSVSLGRLDIKLRRFTKKNTEYKDDFDKATASGRETRTISKDEGPFDKEMLRSNIKIALIHLNLAKKLAEIDTRPDADMIRMRIP